MTENKQRCKNCKHCIIEVGEEPFDYSEFFYCEIKFTYTLDFRVSPNHWCDLWEAKEKL